MGFITKHPPERKLGIRSWQKHGVEDLVEDLQCTNQTTRLVSEQPMSKIESQSKGDIQKEEG